MELVIAGGCGEHGRSCYFVQGASHCFLVDCGLAAGPEDGRPALSREQIGALDAVFLTHSHRDHTGALSWLAEQGYRGPVIASEETFRQLGDLPGMPLTTEKLFPDGRGEFCGIRVRWGRSGHCAGSIWYDLRTEGKRLLFSGDYTEHTRLYRCDPIRGVDADVAVLDCAYASRVPCYREACRQLTRRAAELLARHPALLLPVPKDGRGPELLSLLAEAGLAESCHGDEAFRENCRTACRMPFWYLDTVRTLPPVAPLRTQMYGLVFVSDPQLSSPEAQAAAGAVLSGGGCALMTGTPEEGSFSESLLSDGRMELACYPVHQNWSDLLRLLRVNSFDRVIPSHCPDLRSPAVHQF